MITVPIVRVGNSRGIRIPKKLLEAIGSPDAISVELQEDTLVLRPITLPRSGWDNQARWRDTELSTEDHECLDAQLTNEEDD